MRPANGGNPWPACGRALSSPCSAIYALLAVALRSFSQPLIIMVAIPFGVVGALLGHRAAGLRPEHDEPLRDHRAIPGWWSTIHCC
ncbi:MAG: hypothetical protein U5J62_08855 [Desulfurivibrio sp.]|nr:hypothetical protein [Desulfurivibrio sp.]